MTISDETMKKAQSLIDNEEAINNSIIQLNKDKGKFWTEFLKEQELDGDVCLASDDKEVIYGRLYWDAPTNTLRYKRPDRSESSTAIIGCWLFGTIIEQMQFVLKTYKKRTKNI